VLKQLVRLALAGILLGAGVGHFTATEAFRAQVPKFLPAADLIIYLSGIIELLLATLLLLLPKRRAEVGVAVAAFFVLIFPGNVSQYLTSTSAFGLDSDTARAGRLLFQPILVALVLWSTGGWQLLRRQWQESRASTPY
jgi:uncharacterized membrane protein